MNHKKKPENSKTQEARRDRKRRASFFVGNIRHSSTARFGAALREKRKALRMTQAELADKARLSRTFISEIECGKESISLERAERLAKSVECELSDLLSI